MPLARDPALDSFSQFTEEERQSINRGTVKFAIFCTVIVAVVFYFAFEGSVKGAVIAVALVVPFLARVWWVRDVRAAIAEAERRVAQNESAEEPPAPRGVAPTSGMRAHPVQVPFEVGVVGTGPVDLSLATQSLMLPEGFDHPGGSGQIFFRAYQWFMDAAEAADSQPERANNYVGAARALNNLAVWCLVKSDDPDRRQSAYDALREAERITSPVAQTPDDLRGAILANLGGLLAGAGAEKEARTYLANARVLGVTTT